jgi:hypothetical protein
VLFAVCCAAQHGSLLCAWLLPVDRHPATGSSWLGAPVRRPRRSKHSDSLYPRSGNDRSWSKTDRANRQKYCPTAVTNLKQNAGTIGSAWMYGCILIRKLDAKRLGLTVGVFLFGSGVWVSLGDRLHPQRARQIRSGYAADDLSLAGLGPTGGSGSFAPLRLVNQSRARTVSRMLRRNRQQSAGSRRAQERAAPINSARLAGTLRGQT